jgi:hypothetical protein
MGEEPWGTEEEEVAMKWRPVEGEVQAQGSDVQAQGPDVLAQRCKDVPLGDWRRQDLQGQA